MMRINPESFISSSSPIWDCELPSHYQASSLECYRRPEKGMRQ